MRFLTAFATFVIAAVAGFGIEQYRGSGVSDYMRTVMACEAVKVAREKGYLGATARQGLIDAVMASPKADDRLKATMEQMKQFKASDC